MRRCQPVEMRLARERKKASFLGQVVTELPARLCQVELYGKLVPGRNWATCPSESSTCESSASERVAKTLPATTAWAAPTLAALAGRGHKRGFAAVSQLEELRFGSLLNLGLTAPLTEPTVFLRASVSTAQAPASSCVLALPPVASTAGCERVGGCWR